MMSQFSLFFELGINHILNLDGFDHILFIIALCAIYKIEQWKNVLILVTSFTIGHSITLALSSLNILLIDSDIVEFLIPVTIFITAFFNFFYSNRESGKKNFYLKYFIALFFGLIHGLGFSNYLKSLLGKDMNIASQLLAFNLGLEVGQIVIVGIILLSSFFGINILQIKTREWNLVLSGAAAGISLYLLINFT